MVFQSCGGRALADIEASLTQSDPGLAAKLERFSTRCPRCPAGRNEGQETGSCASGIQAPSSAP
jgi:hypothetical protein